MIDLRALLMAKIYDRAMRNVERRCLAQWREELLSPLRGDILEIGSGTGINLHYYSQQLSRLVLSEPDPHMRNKLQSRINGSEQGQVEILSSYAEQIDLPDASFDHIVSTLVLCSVANIEKTLHELRRLLKSGGSLVFFEHVHAHDNPGVSRLQKRLEPIWKWCAGNCHLTRPTGQLLQQAGFETRLEQTQMRGVPSFVRPVIKGTAFRS